MATSKSLPVEYTITAYTGATFQRIFRWLPDGVTPASFQGWSATMLVGPNQGKALLSATPALQSDGRIVVRLSAAQTAPLRAGTYSYVVDLIDPDGNVIRFLRGGLQVIKDVTP